MQVPGMSIAATAAVAVAAIVPLVLTVSAAVLVAVVSIFLGSDRRRYALLVLDRLIKLAATLRGKPPQPQAESRIAVGATKPSGRDS